MESIDQDITQASTGVPASNQAEVSTDNPQEGNSDQKAANDGIGDQEKKDLLEVRKTFKESFSGKRRIFVRRSIRAFEFLKNNPYILFNEDTLDFDTLSTVLGGGQNQNQIQAYQYNDNIYQMLGLAFIAALSPDVPKTRFQPVDPEDEEDIMVASKASDIQADNERKNGIKALQKLELLYLWCTGSYFAYTRNIVDKNRAGVTRDPVMEMQMKTVLPARFICPSCGEVTPEDDINPFQSHQTCKSCGQKLSGEDYYQEVSMPVPTKVGEIETPNSMTCMTILSGLNVDADPDALELDESGILDFEGEVNIAAVRSSYPGMYQQLQRGEPGDTSGGENTAKQARKTVTSPSGSIATTSGDCRGTYSRCWIQPWAFSILEDQGKADRLRTLFPDGCRLVTYGEVFLQAVPERMMDHWTWCPTIKGIGLYPFGVGDAALDIQVRINDCANTVHAYMDRLAFGTVFFDADKIDWAKITSKPLNPGNGTPINRQKDDGSESKIEDLIYQPQFHIDSKIYEYGASLVQLAQVIAGVQPQTFGGSDPNVKTMGGQEQALRTALGRMKLFWDQIREEHAARASQSVRCTIANMEDKLKITKGDEEGGFSQITLLKQELTGDFLAYAESDDGFPSSYAEVQQRIMELMSHVKDNPFLIPVLTDPDTQKVVARYLLPEGIKLPGDRERARLKILIKMMSKESPTPVPGPTGIMLVPSRQLDEDYDDAQMATQLARNWLQENWQMQEGPNQEDKEGFSNVLSFLKQAAFVNAKNAAKQALVMAQQAAGGEAGGPPPGGGGPEQAPPQQQAA